MSNLICSFCIPFEEWKNLIEKYATYGYTGKLKYLECGISNYMALLAQNNGINCWLRSVNNWFRNTDSTWVGSFGCDEKSCKVKYNLVSNRINENEDVIINVYASETPSHKQAALAVITEKVEQVQVKNEYDGHESIKVTHEISEAPSEQISWESVKQYREKVVEKRPKSTRIRSKSIKTPNIKAPESSSSSSSPLFWSCEEMGKFVSSIAGPEIAAKFKTQDIDGRALEYLKIETLVEVLSIQLGYAAKIKFEFDKLVKPYEIR